MVQAAPSSSLAATCQCPARGICSAGGGCGGGALCWSSFLRKLTFRIVWMLRERNCNRDNRPAVNKDVPTFLVYPDGSHSLGVISPAGGRQDEGSDGPSR